MSAPYAGHAFGARHFDNWCWSNDRLTGSEVLTLSVVCNQADLALMPGGSGYFGISSLNMGALTRVSTEAATRRLDKLVEVGALIKRKTLGTDRYWLPEEIE